MSDVGVDVAAALSVLVTAALLFILCAAYKIRESREARNSTFGKPPTTAEARQPPRG